MKDFWKIFLTSNETKYRLARTILQGIIGVLIANADLIVSQFHLSADMKALVVALVMAILSPLMSELGASLEASDRATREQFTVNTDSLADMVEGYEDEDENDLSKQ